MDSSLRVKICGLRRFTDVSCAVAAGVHYIGFNFFRRSSRYVTPKQTFEITRELPHQVVKVGLFVDAENSTIDDTLQIVQLDALQLHGSESPQYVQDVRDRYELPVIKAIGLASIEDLAILDEYVTVADQILLDAKHPFNGSRPGGNGVPFDWTLISEFHWSVPWILAGGLTAENLVEAVRITGARQVDLASGVENAPGIKDGELMKAFMHVARQIQV